MSLKSQLEKMPFYNVVVLPVHYVQAVQASRKYQKPAQKLRVIAVTGTNGKTTTCFMIWKMLNEAGHKTGLLTTVGWGGVGLADGGQTSTSEDKMDATILHRQYEHMTTERVGVLNARMRAIADAGAEFMVLEVTSHALAQYRTLGVPIEIAVLTNITHEHLDYHKTFANYRSAKMKLFKKARFGVLNADEENLRYFESCFQGENGKKRAEYITYGIKNGDLRAKRIKMDENGINYACGDMKIRTQIPGEFNVYNSLAAVAVGQRLGLSEQEIQDGIFALESVEGRMTRIREGQDFGVIVDYAHQPDALEKVFASVGHGAGFAGKIISVHGGAGRRDHSTRRPRGEILGKNSDVVIITEDDSRDEDPAEIAQDFVVGVEAKGKKLGEDLFVELDREKAIRKALRMAGAGDLVLILGKGHEKTILRADGAHEFEDIKVAKKCLRELMESA